MTHIARINAFLGLLLRPLCETIASQHGTPEEMRNRTEVYLLLAKLVVIALVLNVPGFVLMQMFGNQWIFAVWFLVNIFAWAGPLVGSLLQGSGATDDSARNDER